MRRSLHGGVRGRSKRAAWVKNIVVAVGEPPSISFEHDGQSVAWRSRLIVGADGRNSTVRRQLGFPVLHDEPHNLLGGMLIDGVPEWPQEVIEAGTEGDIHHLVFPQGGAKLRLYVCYGFDGRERFTGVGRERNLLNAFRMKCLPWAKASPAVHRSGHSTRTRTRIIGLSDRSRQGLS